MKFKNKHRRGFTLIEVLLTIGLLAFSTALIVPVSGSLIAEDRAANEAAKLTANIFQYQQYSYSRKDNQQYGFEVREDGYTMFTSDGVTRLEDLDKDFVFESGVTMDLESPIEVMFQEGSFRPVSSVNFVLKNSSTEILLEVNEEGLIDYAIN